MHWVQRWQVFWWWEAGCFGSFIIYMGFWRQTWAKRFLGVSVILWIESTVQSFRGWPVQLFWSISSLLSGYNAIHSSSFGREKPSYSISLTWIISPTQQPCSSTKFVQQRVLPHGEHSAYARTPRLGSVRRGPCDRCRVPRSMWHERRHLSHSHHLCLHPECR